MAPTTVIGDAEVDKYFEESEGDNPSKSTLPVSISCLLKICIGCQEKEVTSAGYLAARLARERHVERNKRYFYVMSQGNILKCSPKAGERMQEIVRDDGSMIWHGYQVLCYMV